MISFKLFLENQRKLQERRTIPLNMSDPIEKNFESKLDKNYDYADNIIRWYKNSKREGMSSSELNSIYKANLDNLIDLLDDYKDCVKKISNAGKKTLTVNVKTRQGTKPYNINDLDKFNFIDIAQNFIKAVCDEAAKLSTVSTGKAKYQITNEDAQKIYLLDFSSHVALWVTEGPDRDTTNKLVYQLWQNTDDADSKMDRGDVYGNPDNFSPYCTHSENHWKAYSKKAYKNDPNNYQQFWYLKKIPGVNYAKGNLTNKNVQKIFEKMQGTGPDTIICMNDSIDEMLDRYDDKVRDLSKLEFGNEIEKIQNENFTKIDISKVYSYDAKGLSIKNGPIEKHLLFLKDQTPNELANFKSRDIEKEGYPETFHGNISIRTSKGFKLFLQHAKNLKTVTGDFNFINCSKLKSLKGTPKEINGDFFCSNCSSLKSLEGGPEIVGGLYDCSYCDSLESLEGAPKEAKSDFFCFNCNSLKSLKGAPEKAEEYFVCHSCDSLESLEGAPKEVGGNFDCSKNKSLKNLKGSPVKVKENFDCSYCDSLEYLNCSTKEVGGDFWCSYCDSLKSLEGAPEKIEKDLVCRECRSLKDIDDKSLNIGGKLISKRMFQR